MINVEEFKNYRQALIFKYASSADEGIHIATLCARYILLVQEDLIYIRRGRILKVPAGLPIHRPP